MAVMGSATVLKVKGGGEDFCTSFPRLLLGSGLVRRSNRRDVEGWKSPTRKE